MAFKPPSSPVPPSGGPGGFRPRPAFQRGNTFNKNDKDDVRTNERIRVPQVRLIDENGEQVGIVATQEALRMARDKGLDLMEVAANANPPVCKITDYGKFKYEKKKQEARARKNQVVVKVKEVQLRPKTDKHDLEYKIKNLKGFIEDGDKVKIVLMFRGREITFTKPGFDMMEKIIQETQEIAVVEAAPKLDGKKLIMVLAPASMGKKSSSPAKATVKPAASVKPAGQQETKSTGSSDSE